MVKTALNEDNALCDCFCTLFEIFSISLPGIYKDLQENHHSWLNIHFKRRSFSCEKCKELHFLFLESELHLRIKALILQILCRLICMVSCSD